MLFSRTLRRKLVRGVGLVLGMLLILSATGLMGLYSYRTVIHDLNDNIDARPQRSELIDSLVGLDELFVVTCDAQQLAEHFRMQLSNVREALDKYRRRIEALPPAAGFAGQRPVTEVALSTIEERLTLLDSWRNSLTDDDARVTTLSRMRDQVARMLMAARGLPVPDAGLRKTIEHARSVYRSALVTVWVASAVVLALFAGLLRYGYTGIFHPIHELHQGALRVAHGDFDYRVKLKTRDEMAELAAAFNQMTSRFQEVAADLDAQVQERSRQLVRSERLASIGFLAAGVAHEINNPLSAIAMAAESLEGRIAGLLGRLEQPDADVVRQYLQMIQSESFRCKQITERLLDFSRARDAVREPTDLARVVAEVVAMVQHLSKYRGKNIEFLHAEPCCAEVASSEIKQVVLNLIANGLDAVERGGTLRIELIDQTDHVRIEFHDDGCGMTAEVLENMFEPFYSSKPHGQGTGLGLSISHRIVSQHGGTISASSPGPGLGSTFVVRLPRRAAESSAAA